MKEVILLVIIFGCSMIAKIKSDVIKQRYENLKQILFFLNGVKIDVEMKNQGLGDVLKNARGAIGIYTKKIAAIMETRPEMSIKEAARRADQEDVLCQKLCLSRDDKEELLEYLLSLSAADKEAIGQSTLIYRQGVMKKIEYMEKEELKKVKMIRSLGVLCGLVIAILIF